MSQREILLHVGHGKTGSSFVQSALALSGTALDGFGIAYPISAKSKQSAKAGYVTSGNLGNDKSFIINRIHQGMMAGYERVLISSEFLFQKLLSKDISYEFSEIRSRFPGAMIRVLLYIRDPLDHAASAYQQRVKRGAFTGSFAESINNYMIPFKVGQFVKDVTSAGVDLTVLNYSRHAKELLGSIEGWLGLPLDTLQKPPFDRINRSMTLAELELQRHFNVYFGKGAARFVSDPLCNRLPEIRSEAPSLSREELVIFLARMKQMINESPIAVAAPSPEGYRLPSLDEAIERFTSSTVSASSSYPYAFSSAQLKCIVEAIYSEVQR